jgi:hypothetical protein
MEVVDFIPQLRTIDSEFLEYVMLFSRWRESEEVAAFHLFLCLRMYSFKTTEGSLTPCLKTRACARPVRVTSVEATWMMLSVWLFPHEAFSCNSVEAGADSASASMGAGGWVVAIVHPIQARMPNIPATAMNAVTCKTTVGKA